MKNDFNRASDAKVYSAPSTMSVSIHSGLVCQVTSVHGNGPGFDGEQETIDPG